MGAVARHLALCHDCAREEIALRQTALLFAGWPEVPLPESVTQRIRLEARPHLAALRNLPLNAPPWSWSDRWASLREVLIVERRRVAPFAFATLAAATLCAVLVLLRDPTRASYTAGVFLAGMWCACVANGVMSLVFGEPGSTTSVFSRLRIDLRATALTGAAAGGMIALLFVMAGVGIVTGVAPIHDWTQSLARLTTGNLLSDAAVRIATYGLVSFLAIALAVALAPRQEMLRGRISGTLTALIYSSITAPVIYIAMGFRLDSLWLAAIATTLVCALAGGLVGDSLLMKQKRGE
jgi:hypothetical protein